MSLAKTVWTITPEAFDSLLYSLDSDRDRAGRIYENIRRKLLEFFEARGSVVPDEHTDETFDRVMRRMIEGEKVGNPAAYCYGVAKFVWIEASRRRAKDPLDLDENAFVPAINPNDDVPETAQAALEQKLDCLENCLDSLAAATRSFIIEYYREEEGPKIEQRRMLAVRLNTSLNALRLRASRLRRELGKCTSECTEREIREPNVVLNWGQDNGSK